MSPEFEERLAYSATQVGSFEKAAAMSRCWGSPISDDAIHALEQRSAGRSRQIGPPPSPPPKAQESAFSLIVMFDGWMARERGEAWGLPPGPCAQERVAWREVKSAVVYRVEDRAENASGRGMLIEKKVVAAAPGTDVVDFGSMVQEQAMRCGLAQLGGLRGAARGSTLILPDRIQKVCTTEAGDCAGSLMGAVAR